jgi:hypothetical protein
MEKRKPGRPAGTKKGVGVRIAIALTLESWTWLKNQPLRPAKVIERLIKKEVDREK